MGTTHYEHRSTYKEKGPYLTLNTQTNSHLSLDCVNFTLIENEKKNSSPMVRGIADIASLIH